MIFGSIQEELMFFVSVKLITVLVTCSYELFDENLNIIGDKEMHFIL